MEESNKDLLATQYVIIPGKMPWDCAYKSVYNDIYNFWESVWTKTFEESGAPESQWRDHFIRQDVVVALKAQEEIVGVHLYTLYNLEAQSSLDAEYFAYVSELSVARLKKMNFTRTMSMEYLATNPNWSRNSQAVSVGRLISVLGSYMSESLDADCALGMPIKGTSVDKFSENIGGYPIQEGIKKYGYELKLMVMPSQPKVESKDEKVGQLAKTLWNQRKDYSQLTVQPAAVRKAA